MKKAFAGKRKVLIIGIVFVIAIVGIMATPMVKQPDEAGKRAEPTENELPTEVKSEIERLLLEPEIHITRWSVNTAGSNRDKRDKFVDIHTRKVMRGFPQHQFPTAAKRAHP